MLWTVAIRVLPLVLLTQILTGSTQARVRPQRSVWPEGGLPLATVPGVFSVLCWSKSPSHVKGCLWRKRTALGQRVRTRGALTVGPSLGPPWRTPARRGRRQPRDHFPHSLGSRDGDLLLPLYPETASGVSWPQTVGSGEPLREPQDAP